MDLFPPDLCLYNKRKEFSGHGTISSIVYQNIIITAVLEISEFRVRSFLREWGWKKKTYASLTGLRMSVSPYVTQGLGVLVFRMLAFKIWQYNQRQSGEGLLVFFSYPLHGKQYKK